MAPVTVLATGTGVLTADAPWPGLRPFGESDRIFFFGRGREIAELLALIGRAPVVVLYGQSGLGKTSILQAGLFHELRALDLRPCPVRFNHAEDAPPFAEQVKAALVAALDNDEVVAPRPGAGESLWHYFHRRDVDFWGPRNRLLTPVIIIDQFEEMFTLGQRTPAGAERVAAFVDELEAVLEHRPPQALREALELRPEDALAYDFERQNVKFVLTLREDFLAHLDTWRGRMPSLLPHRFRLERMTGAQAFDVVQRAGGELVSADVAREIVDFVSASRQRQPASDLTRRIVEPALLSVVCDELNRRRIERDQAQITLDLLSDERAGIIEGFYERSFVGIDPRTREWIEDDLLTASGYRDRGALEDALQLGLSEADFERLVDRRVLHREERGGVVWLELTHDLLADPAARSRSERQHRQAVAAAGRREAEAAQRLRRATRLVMLFGGLFLVTLAALGFAGVKWREAIAAQKQAREASGRARSAAQAAGVAADNAFRSAQMADVEAARATTSFQNALATADRLGSRLMDYVRRDMRVPTSTVLEVIRGAEDSYQMLAVHNPESLEVKGLHTRFLVTAAEARYQVGHIAQGLEHARSAVALSDAIGETAGVPGFALTRAEAHYAEGMGRLALGALAPARRDFAGALALVPAVSTDSESVRLLCLVHLALGNLELSELNGTAARSQFSHVLRILDRATGLDRADALGWRVQALQGMANSHYRLTDVSRWLKEAVSTLETARAGDSQNPRWLRLDAQLMYLQGRNALELGLTQEAARFHERARAGTDALAVHDPANLEWELNATRVARGLAAQYRYQSQPVEALKVLEDAQRRIRRVLQAAPQWSDAAYTNGALLFDMAEAHAAQNNTHGALELFEVAAAQMAAIVRRAPDDRQARRGVAVAIAGQARMHRDLKETSRANALFEQALAMVVPLTRRPGVDEQVFSDKTYLLREIAAARNQIGRRDQAKLALADAIRTVAALTDRHQQPANYVDLSDTHLSLGDVLVQEGDYRSAKQQYELAEAAIHRGRALQPQSEPLLLGLSRVHRSKATLLVAESRLQDALAQAERGIDIIWDALGRQPAAGDLQSELRDLRTVLERVDAAAGKSGAAAAQVKAAATKLLAERKLANKADWLRPPQMVGNWRNLLAIELRENRKILLNALYANDSALIRERQLTPESIVAIRSMSLLFYDGAALHEAAVLQNDGSYGIVPFVTREDRPTVVLDGKSPPIHQMNAETPPQMEDPQIARQYLSFFDTSVHGERGPFTLLEEPGQILWRADATPATKALVASKIVPLSIERAERGWKATGTILYANAIFKATQIVQPAGMVEMIEDDPLLADLPILEDYFNDGLKVSCDPADLEVRLSKVRSRLRDSPDDLDLLRQLAEVQNERHEWAQAVDAQQRLIALGRRGTPRQDTAGDYVSLSWYQLFVRDFAGALASTEAGLQLEPASLPLATNRAHALLFLGRTQEAEQIYVSNKGKPIQAGSSRLWEDVILEDFAQLTQANLSNPEMDRIRRLLKPTRSKAP